MRTARGFVFVIGLFCALAASRALADELRVAVASNFTAAAREIAARFEAESGHRVVLAFGSTGKHYAQIRNGAPFAVFLAADARRPRLLEDEGLAVPGTRFTYALGTLVLWSPDASLVDTAGAVLATDRFTHLALANPKLAPYGEAARAVLRSRGLWNALADRIVRGENIGQTFQFIRSGNAELGFVAHAQVIGQVGSLWTPPQTGYPPIVQQAVLLHDDAAARAFLDYLRSAAARKVITRFGYGAP